MAGEYVTKTVCLAVETQSVLFRVKILICNIEIIIFISVKGNEKFINYVNIQFSNKFWLSR